MTAQEVEESLTAACGFRVTKPGNRKIEFLHHYGEGDQQMLRVKSTRPATPQECSLWDTLVAVMEGLSSEGYAVDAKDFLPGGGGMDAYQARNSLGHPKP